MADWKETRKGSTTYTKAKPKSGAAKDLQDVAVRGLIGRIAGDWAPLIDAGMTLMGTDTTEALGKGRDFLGNVAKGYWETMGEDTSRAAYDALTRKRGLGDEELQADGSYVKGPVAQKEGSPKFWKDFEKGTTQPGLMQEDPFFNPKRVTEDPDTKRWSGRFKYDTSEKPEGDEWSPNPAPVAGWARPFYDNPETTARVVGATAAAAPLLAGGAFLSAFAQGGKPRSDYAYPVEPTRGGYDDVGGIGGSSNVYNPSVESARASAQFKHQLQEQKHEHDIQLQLLRNQNHTPGVQSPMGSSMPNVSSADPFGMDMFGGSKRYF